MANKLTNAGFHAAATVNRRLLAASMFAGTPPRIIRDPHGEA